MKRKNVWKLTAGCMAVTMVIGCVQFGASAAPTAGISGYTSGNVSYSELPTAGISFAMSRCVAEVGEAGGQAREMLAVTRNENPVVTSEYENMAVATVNDFVNVRAEASTDSEVVGKLYKNNVGEVSGEKDGWYKIKSGNVTGYVSGDYIVVGDEEKIKEAGRRIAVVKTETLFVRKGASTDDSVIGMVPEGEDLTVVDESVEGWVKVSVEEGDGYVSGEYVELSTEYTYAESKEEEAARLKKEEEARKAAEVAAAAQQRPSSGGSSSGSTAGSRSYNPPSGSSGADVARFACQFVGNPYVYGGSSLTHGTDCSGFVMSVYANFGVSLPHSSSAQRSCGYGVSVSDMQAGDIVCYSGHVGIYIGGGQIVHASNRRDGIKISNVSYRSILAVRRIF